MSVSDFAHFQIDAGGDALSGNGPSLTFQISSDKQELFFELTKSNISRPLCIVADGKILTCPIIQAAIKGGKVTLSVGEASANIAGYLQSICEDIQQRQIPIDLELR